LVLVLAVLWVPPAVPLREALSSHRCFVPVQTFAAGSCRHLRGRGIARELRATRAVRRQPPRLELRAGLRDAVTNLWPFKKASEADQYADRKDVWNSLVMLDQVTGGELQVIVNALTATGLWKELSAEGTDGKNQKPVTLFAALNSAFDRLPPDCLLADCVAALDGPEPMKKALLDELRSSLLGSIADGRYSVSALDGKKTAITTRCGRSANFDLMPGTRASDFTDYVLDMELRRKVKVCSASALVSTDIQCSNGVIHVVDKLPDGSVPIVRLFSSAATPPLKNVTEAAANKLQAALYTARKRKAELEAELTALKPMVAEKKLTRESIKELVDTYSRQAADFDAYKARSEEDLAKVQESAATAVLNSLSKVLDTFELAEQNIKPDTPAEEAIHARYQYVNQVLLTLLEEQGVHRVEALGKSFDAREHEAVQMQVPAASPSPPFPPFQRPIARTRTLVCPRTEAVTRARSWALYSVGVG